MTASPLYERRASVEVKLGRREKKEEEEKGERKRRRKEEAPLLNEERKMGGLIYCNQSIEQV